MDTLEGAVTVTALHDTRFEDIDIALTGEWLIIGGIPRTTPDHIQAPPPVL